MQVNSVFLLISFICIQGCINNTEIDNSEFFIPEDVQNLIHLHLPNYEIASSNEYQVPIQWSPVEQKYYYPLGNTHYFVVEDFNRDHQMDYALILSKEELTPSKSDTIFYWTLVFAVSEESNRYVLRPQDPIIAGRVGSNLIQEKIGILKAGAYRRGYPYYDTLQLNQVSVGHSLYECCVKTYIWDNNSEKFKELLLWHVQ